MSDGLEGGALLSEVDSQENQRNEVLDCMVYAFAAYTSLPHSDSMMQPPKPVYVDAVSGKPLRRMSRHLR